MQRVLRNLVEARPFAVLTGALGLAIVLWLILSLWPEWLDGALGSKKLSVSMLLNGLTLAGLYFLVASGFTLVFGLRWW